ncbi:DNA replication/repair protein RecF [Rhodobacter capsulatus]|uniref:DNA replication/repair protein RecF n=1 Tax=Rhodobacter capsulatus TaxID=1061 RepID=UPI0006DCC28C|nr:DNA replication/repair protein RecF [Rhodobacter capsulatus]KQB14591.1 recombinase RecF [Rhodobacter capsulatus]KQB14890.1 recombinase RecF [Rhodobacter capsulatus]PZX25021.1 DNA replication and repair protein RecF [Rhodobacter capsulatus]QNR63269.1 DNA replication/repair protein RecF [Rhodobacter capsulatus]
MLRDLTLLQFRSHRRAVLAVDARPVALYGPNGAGKTSVLEAVSLLSPGRGLRRASAEELIRRQEQVGWKIRATLSADEIETSALPGSSREVLIDGKAAAQVALGRLLRVLWLVPAMDRLWIEAAEGRRRFLDRMTLSFFPTHAEAVLAYEKAMRERNRLLKDEIRDAAWYAALEARMAEAGALMTGHRRQALAQLASAQRGAATAFPAADLGLTQEGPEDLAAALAEGRRRDMAAGRTLEGPHRVDLTAVYAEKAIPADQCSTGEQKALLISLLLANARALAGENTVLLLDEVAAHLDAGRRAALYDEICALPAQVLMTGTGAELFDTLGDRGRYWQVTEVAGTSELVESRP